MDGQRFDQIAKALAERCSRRGILKGLAATAAATAASSLGTRTSVAQSDCAQFCQTLPPGSQRGRCRSDCAHGEGVFFACEGDPARLCMAPDGSASCCDAGATCGGGGVAGVCGTSCIALTCADLEVECGVIDDTCGGFPDCGPCDLCHICETNQCVAIDCDDSDACTADSCDPNVGCVNVQINCDDGDPCTMDSCDSGSGCVNTLIGGCHPCASPDDCDDGDPCTENHCRRDDETALFGVCVYLPIADCVEPVICTSDADCVSDDPCIFGRCSIDSDEENSLSLQPTEGQCVFGPACSTVDSCEVATCDPDSPDDLCSYGPKCAESEVCHAGRCYIPGICEPAQAFVCGLDFEGYQVGVCSADPAILCHCYDTPSGSTVCVFEEFCGAVQPCGEGGVCPDGRVCVMSCCNEGQCCQGDGQLFPACFRACEDGIFQG